jgi:acetate kinase
MRDPILVINAGSSSIKFSVFKTAADRSLRLGAHGQVESIGASPQLEIFDARGQSLVHRPVAGADHAAAIAAINAWFATQEGGESGFGGIGHRVVHGGPGYREPVRIDAKVLADLEALVPLAPLHQPHHLAAIRAAKIAAPDVPQIACFDTAFHHSAPALAQHFALPRELSARGIRRYGFHGLSYEYIISVLPQVAPECAGRKVVVAHLGNGASMCAINQGRSVATTMSFTPVDGLVMGTRTGALDPGVILYLIEHEKMPVEEVQALVYQRSGLLGVSGLSSDMRALLASDASAAREAVDLFVYRIGRELGSLCAALGGLDALVFTAGIGENAAEIRARVCRDAAWLGVTLDEAANARHGPQISARQSRVPVFVVATDENLMIARHTRQLIDQPRPAASRPAG